MFQFNQLRPQLTSSPSPAKGVSGLQFPLLLMEYLGGIMDLTGVNSTWVGDPAIVAGDVANSNIKALGYGQVLVNWLGLDLWLRLRRCLNIYLVHAHIIIYNYLYNIFICVCVCWICMHFFHNIYIFIYIYIYIYLYIYIYILYYCTIYHDLWPSLVGSNRVQGSRDIGKSANPKCLAFFWLDSTRICWISFGMFFNWGQALSTSQGILLHTHCTTASVFSWQNLPWQVMADQSRWFIKEKPLEDRIKVLYGMWTFHDLLNDSKNQIYAANVVIQNHAKKKHGNRCLVFPFM